jgi:hypothetical protein
MRLRKIFYLTLTVTLLLPFITVSYAKPVEDKVAVLITDWGTPAGFNFEYAWTSHSLCRVGDRTHYPGELCKIGHVGDFPYQTHIGILPWALTCSWPGWQLAYDNSGIYQLSNGVYVPMDPNLPSLTPSIIPAGTPVIPAVEITNQMTGVLQYPPDPRTGEDLLAGWYKIGSYDVPFQNGSGDLYEAGPLTFLWYHGITGGPDEPPDAYLEDIHARKTMDLAVEMLEKSFGDKIDVRIGYYSTITGYEKHEQDVAEEFANEGFRKMILGRETTDNNNYANEFMTGNFVKERLCELGVLDEMEIYHTRQVGRTPEFNAMNIINLKMFIEAYPEGSRIAILYTTRGRNLFSKSSSFAMASQFPQCNEVFHENAFLNYLSCKKALERAYGDRYDLVFTKGDVESDFLPDNLYSYGLTTAEQNGGWFKNVRDSIQLAKEEGLDKIIIVPAHWYFDNIEDAVDMRILNNLPLSSKENMEAGVYEITSCEDILGNEVTCGTAGAAAEITICPAYGNVNEEFATAYYVVLRGTLERFGLYPKDVDIKVRASQLVTKLNGGTVEVTDSNIKGARIVIPPDPYPDRPESFTPETVVPPSSPEDTNNCLWEDTVIIIGQQTNPPAMKSAQPVGPAIHFGPYRNFFNRDVTITIPYTKDQKVEKTQDVKVYIYNHVTDDWDPIDVDSIDTVNRLVTFRTQVLGLFRVGVEK